MKKSIFLVVVAVAALLMSSCTKESTVVLSDSERLAMIRNEISLNPSLFNPPSSEEVMAAYQSGGGLKNGMSDPKVGYCLPLNEVVLLHDGMFQRVWIWSIVNNDWLIDKGVVVITYDSGYNQIGTFDFYIGWENDYCEKVFINSNVEGNVEIKLILSYQVMDGQFSFETYVFNGKEPAIFLPQIDFNCAWEVQGDGTVFGGTFPLFNPRNQKELAFKIGLGLYSNIKYYVKFPTQNGTMPNSIMTVWVYGEDMYGIKSTIIYPDGNTLPGWTMIDESFEPKRISFQSKTYINDRAVYGEYFEKDLFMVSEGVYSF